MNNGNICAFVHFVSSFCFYKHWFFLFGISYKMPIHCCALCKIIVVKYDIFLLNITFLKVIFF